MLLDGLDVVIVELFGPGGMGDHYHNIDKVLDLYYLSLEAYVSRAWDERIPRPDQPVAVWLSRGGRGAVRTHRLAADPVHLSEPVRELVPVRADRLAVLSRVKLDTWRRCLGWLVVLYIPKLAQEYLLHVAEAQPWGWLKQRLGL